MAKIEHNRNESIQYRNILDRLGKTLERLSRRQKRLTMMAADAIIFSFCLYFALILRLGSLDNPYLESLVSVFIFVSVFGVFSNWFFGVYKTLSRSFDFRSVNVLATSCVATGLAIAAFAYFFENVFLPRSTPIIFILLTFLLVGASRVMARWLYQYSVGATGRGQSVLIFGADEVGNKVAGLLSGSPDFSLVGFVDDDPTLWGSYMRGRMIYSHKDVPRLVRRYGSVKILLSVTNLDPATKRDIYARLTHPNVSIGVIPSLTDVVTGRTALSGARDLRIEDLLGREEVPPIDDIFSESIRGSTVLVTGGGGSIGSEISRQILANDPAHLVIMEQNELALYKIENELKKIGSKSKIDFFLGSVSDRAAVQRLLESVCPDIVFHAAAYKHVPIVEKNVLEGVRNNILGTYIMASESEAAGVARFTLISTDKAVRPPNVMGATKRFAELIVQALADRKPAKGSSTAKTIFSMVRFGNVLGSSGSVIPMFKAQIDHGGPVTVTHKEVTRYFMTIREAAQLVVQASFLAKGGEVFLLDMGEPVKIDDLARLAIQLSGETVRDADNPNGDISIEYVGLRPGEKLYEEMLIDDNVHETRHPKIMMAKEKYLPRAAVEKYIATFTKQIEKGDNAGALKILEKVVSGFTAKRG